MTAPDERWYESAMCASIGSGPFFAEKGGAGLAAGRAICHGCPVIDACLRSAMVSERFLDDSQIVGMFGGLSPKHRRELRAAVRS